MNGGYFLQHLPSILLLVSITVVLTGLFGRQILSKMKSGGSRLKWSSLRDVSNWSSPSWDWLAHWTNKWHGYGRIIMISGTSLFLTLMIGAIVFQNKIGQFPVVEMHSVEVEQAVGEYSYWFRDENGKRLFATFCNTLGYPPPFDRGETIMLLRFVNRGTCWDMHDVHPKYVMLRDKNGDLMVKEN